MQVVRCIDQGETLDTPLDCPDDYRDLMEACWESEPKERPGFDVILSQLETILENAGNNGNSVNN